MTTPRDAVVVGVDDGPDSLLAVRWAAAEADRRAAPLHLVHSMSDGYRKRLREVCSMTQTERNNAGVS